MTPDSWIILGKFAVFFGFIIIVLVFFSTER